MKIISKIPGERVLVSLKEDELSNVLGEYSRYDIKEKFYEQAIKGELEIDISDIYKKHRLIHSLQNQSDYQKARGKLEELLEALTPIESKVSELVK